MPILGIIASSFRSAAGPEGAYDALATVTLSATTASITFAGIPSGYKHLQIRFMGRSTDTGGDRIGQKIQFNSDTSSSYARHQLFGDGSSAAATATSSTTYIASGLSELTAANAPANTFGVGIIDILDYANTSKYKTVRALTGQDQNSTSGRIFLASGLWQSTSAITSIVLAPETGNYVQYTSIALYGIKQETRMPTNTYVALDKVTVGTATPSITFSSIPSGYTDLVMVANFDGSASSYVTLTFNGVSGTSYSRTRLIGNGSSATSDRTANTSGIINLTYNTAGTPVTGIYQIMNYSNTTTYKTVLCRDAAQPDNVAAHVGMFRGSTGSSTEAITSVTLTKGSGNFTSGSTFSLYGIAAASVGAKATGGIIYSDSQYYYHVFGSTGTFTPTQSLTCDYLVVAGGGGGGQGGGGGAGGLRCTVGATGGGGSLESALSLSASTNYTVTVGAGGAGGTGASVDGSTGSNSVFSTITSNGGGGGGSYGTAGRAGLTGGSGGGSIVQNNTGATIAGGTGTANQGYAGGSGSDPGSSPNYFGGAGGGGAGAVGGNGTTGTSAGASVAGDGGAGVTTSISGTSVTYAGGGGGFNEGNSTGSEGGTGGGGNGRDTTHAASAGTINSGGGGGGENASSTGGAGGSGIVIVRYAK